MMDYLVQNEEELVRQAIDGNQRAFTQIYELYFNRIYRYVYSQMGNQAEAEDLTQDVFIKALHSISTFKFKGAPFSSWLFRIAHNQIIDHWRKQKNKKTVSLEQAADVVSNGDPVQMTENKANIEELSEALQQLPPAQREVVTLRFVAGLSIAEVAETLGKREGTVKALQFNGTATLKKLMLDI